MSLRWHPTALLILALLPLTPAIADDSVQVNILVFAQPEHSVSFELWRPASELRLSYPSTLIDLKTFPAGGEAGYTDLGNMASIRLNQAVQRLQANDYRVLLQQSWLQPLSAPEQAPSILMRGGRSIGEHFELEGYITLYQSEQRMRLGTHLWLSSTDPALNSQAASSEANVDVLPDTAPGNGITLKAEMPISAPVSQVVVLNDTRIINSGELTYIDHPRFGVLVEIGSGVPEAEAATSDTATNESAEPAREEEQDNEVPQQ